MCEGYKRECVKGVKREYVKAGCKRECVKGVYERGGGVFMRMCE